MTGSNDQPGSTESSHGTVLSVSERTRLLRAAADGELTAQDRSDLEAHLRTNPDDAAVVLFEQQLRESVGVEIWGEPSAELRARIAGLCAASTSPDHRHLKPLLRRSSFANVGFRWVYGAVAAVLLVAVGTGAWLARPRHNLPPAGTLVTASHREALSSFISAQHKACEVSAAMVSKRFRIGPLSDATAPLSDILGVTPDLSSLNHPNVRYLGASECAVPGDGNSIHIVLDVTPSVTGSSEAALVSLFIQRDTGEVAIETGQAYELTATGGDGPPIVVWRDGVMIYFLRSSSPTELDAVQRAIGVRAPFGSL